MSRPTVAFLLALLQDVSVVRPLALLAARETDADILFLLSHRFEVRDAAGVWRGEVAELARLVGGTVHRFAEAADAFLVLHGRRGALIAGSESDLAAHVEVHEVFRSAPRGLLRVTLQHGLECVGLSQNREHDMAHGQRVAFAADVVCAWAPPARLHSLEPSQRSKVLVTGSAALLARPRRQATAGPAVGLVCENLHSVRMRMGGAHGRPFMETFDAFCGGLAEGGREVALRPHPSGQYVLKNKVALPPNVRLENRPMHQVDLAAYAWGLSAPSTVLLDMVLAGLPVAAWRDPDGVMDAATYDGLWPVSELDDWLRFVREAEARPEAILARQRDWLEGLDMPLDPADVYRRFAHLLVAATGGRATAPRRPAILTGRGAEPRRSMRAHVVSDLTGATQAISFARPLAEGGCAATFADAQGSGGVGRLLPDDAPDVLVLSRLTSPVGLSLAAWARERDVPVVFHIDDDLLDVPEALGRDKAARYRDPELLRNLRANIDASDLVYASTAPLAERLRGHGVAVPVVAGEIYCSVDPAEIGPGPSSATPLIGYMGTQGHAGDLALVLPVVERLMDEVPALEFELFGTIAMPRSLGRFGDRARHHRATPDYTEFLARLRGLGWWVGLAPLADHPFNRCKADTKWVEYSLAGIAVVAEDLPLYRRGCAGGAGRLAATPEAWDVGLRELLGSADARRAAVAAAQERLRSTYAHAALRAQVLEVFATARYAQAGRRMATA